MMGNLELLMLKQRAVYDVAGDHNLHLIHMLMQDTTRADRTASYMSEAGALAYYRGYFRYKLQQLKETAK